MWSASLFLLLGDFWQPAVQDAFGGAPVLRTLKVAREQFPMRGLPDTCLVISHAHRMAINDRENRRLAREGAVLLEHRNQPAADHVPLAGAQARGGLRAAPRSRCAACSRTATTA